MSQGKVVQRSVGGSHSDFLLRMYLFQILAGRLFVHFCQFVCKKARIVLQPVKICGCIHECM